MIIKGRHGLMNVNHQPSKGTRVLCRISLPLTQINRLHIQHKKNKYIDELDYLRIIDTEKGYVLITTKINYHVVPNVDVIPSTLCFSGKGSYFQLFYSTVTP